ncbi:MAG: HAD hydrolase family protein [Phycisphaerae bacterium]|nr:HAD hydrolase family protein [Phycisphaerae bacterium]
MDPARVELIVLDVDGVLTDGSIVVHADGVESKTFHAADGVGIRAWLRLGFRIAVISGRRTPAVDRRLADLGVRDIIQGSTDKARSIDELSHSTGVAPDVMAFVGDDWPDLPALRRVGYPIAVADAHERVRAASVYVTTRPGGRGAVREAIEHLLSARGSLDAAVALYD